MQGLPHLDFTPKNHEITVLKHAFHEKITYFSIISLFTCNKTPGIANYLM
jgi:hypothetical protein